MIKEDITYQDKLNELRLDVSHPNNDGLAYILVEGDTDIRLFRKIFNTKNCKIENIPGGKTKVEACVEILLKITPLTFGIRDADFVKLGYKPYGKTNIFFTDFHDIEMILISRDEVLSAILFEFTDIPQDNHLETRQNIFKTIEEISLLKWLNKIQDLRIDFESTSFVPLISFEEQSVDLQLYFTRLLSKSPSAKITDIQIIKEELNNLKALNPNPLHLCNGHDFMKTLSHFIRSHGKINNITAEYLESASRLKFDSKLFMSTNLYKKTKRWSDQNNCQIYA